MERLHADHDLQRGSRTRFRVVTLVGALWVVIPFVMNSLILAGKIELANDWRSLLVPVVLLSVVVALAIWARDSMTRTHINRMIGAAVLSAMTLNVVGAAVTLARGQPPWEHIHNQTLMFSAIATMVAVSVERWFWIVAVSYLLAFITIPIVGDRYTLYVLGAANSSFLFTAFVLWRAFARGATAERAKEASREERVRKARR